MGWLKTTAGNLLPSNSMENIGNIVLGSGTGTKVMNKQAPGTGIKVRDFHDIGFDTKSGIDAWNDMMGTVGGTGNLAKQRTAYDAQVTKEGAAETMRLQGIEQARVASENAYALEGSQSADVADVQVGGSADIALGTGTATGRRRRTGGGVGVTVGV